MITTITLVANMADAKALRKMTRGAVEKLASGHINEDTGLFTGT